MVQTRSKATSPGHQESRDAFSNPPRNRQFAPAIQPSFVQHVQSMAAAMADLTRQNQDLTREINFRRQRHEAYREEQGQNQGDGRNTESESQSRGTTSRRVPHLERERDQMRTVMDEMRENMRRANPVEDLVHQIDSPFTTSINGHPLDSYDRTRDPFDHIATFKTTMHLQKIPDEIMCRAFPTTLKGPTQAWFSKIPSNSVNSFDELSKLFVNNFIGVQRHKHSSSSLLTIKQGENESLRSFYTSFRARSPSKEGTNER